MSERVLLTGARTAIALEAVRALHRAGHHVFVAETFPDYVTKFSNCVDGAFYVPAPRFEPEAFIERLRTLIEEHGITQLIPTGEEVLYVARGAANLPAHCTLFCAPLTMLEALHDKLRFNRLAAEIGPVPKTWRVEDDEHLVTLCEQYGPFVLKAAHSRFGRSVRIIERGQPCPLPPGRWLAQQRIEGRELCGLALTRSGRVLTQVVYEPRFRLPLGPSYLFAPVVSPSVEAWIDRFVAHHCLTGPIAFDFIESTDGTLYPLECNPRLTSGIHLMTPTTLANALVGVSHPSAPRSEPAMWGIAMLALGLPAVRSLRELRHWTHAFLSARDVFRDRRDPRPAHHLFASWRHLRSLRRKHGLSLSEATTFYTEWNEK